MPITAAEIKIYKTTNGLGGAITATESVSGVSGNVFDTFSGAETSAGGVFYACIYIKNTNATLTAQAVEAFIASETDHDGVNVSLGKGTSAINGVEQIVADENTAPAGVDFDSTDTDTTTSGASTDDGSISIADIPSGEHQAMWLRMTIDAATSAKTGYVADVQIDFDTAE